MIQQNLKASIDLYVSDKIPTGGFLRSVLENDLVGAIGKADLDSIANLKEIISYCYNEIPANCWGSKERVSKWLNPELINS